MTASMRSILMQPVQSIGRGFGALDGLVNNGTLKHVAAIDDCQ
jgi:hypothetical protein